jgi:hypothetical protein
MMIEVSQPYKATGRKIGNVYFRVPVRNNILNRNLATKAVG